MNSRPEWLDFSQDEATALAYSRAYESARAKNDAERPKRMARVARWMKKRGITWHNHDDDPDSRYR